VIATPHMMGAVGKLAASSGRVASCPSPRWARSPSTSRTGSRGQGRQVEYRVEKPDRSCAHRPGLVHRAALGRQRDGADPGAGPGEASTAKGIYLRSIVLTVPAWGARVGSIP